MTSVGSLPTSGDGLDLAGWRQRPRQRQIFLGALDMVESCERLDLRELALRVGLGRATVYRHAGDRQVLLGEVCYERGRRAWRVSLQQSSGANGPTLCREVLRRFITLIAEDEPLHFLFANERDSTLHLLVSGDGPVQPRIVRHVRDLLEQERTAGRLVPLLATDQLAYALVRIAESFVYSDVLAGRTPDLEAANILFAALLP